MARVGSKGVTAIMQRRIAGCRSWLASEGVQKTCAVFKDAFAGKPAPVGARLAREEAIRFTHKLLTRHPTIGQHAPHLPN
jgi:hypothetical protein